MHSRLLSLLATAVLISEGLVFLYKDQKPMTKLTRCKNLSLTGKTNLQNNMHQSKNLLIDWQYLLITSTIFKNKIPCKTLTP